MIQCLRTKFKNFWERSKMTEYEVFLSQAVDLADLENRMKYGYRRNFTPYYDDIRTTNLFYVRGF